MQRTFFIMSSLSTYIKAGSNKYLLSVIVFAIWILFFDRNDLFTQHDRKKELEKLETSKAYYQQEITATKQELAELQDNPAALEKFAREKFYLKRPNEDVFVIADSVTLKN